MKFIHVTASDGEMIAINVNSILFVTRHYEGTKATDRARIVLKKSHSDSLWFVTEESLEQVLEMVSPAN